MLKTKIEWCDSTWNPVTGCRHGCEYCYARGIAKRFSYEGETLDAPCELQRTWIEDSRGSGAGNHVLRYPVSLQNERKVPYPFGFEPTLHRYRMSQPQKWVKPQNIFVCSMADLFGKWVPDEWIKEVLDACEKAQHHRYIFLTKNPDRYGELYRKGMMPKGHKAWNKWYGCSMTKPDDKFYWIDEDVLGIDHYGFISIEPLLADFPTNGRNLPQCIRWIIIGAESGNRKDKVQPEKEWVEHICEVADRTGVKVFMKDSLIPIVGEENMRREFPWEVGTLMSPAKKAGADAAQDVLMPAT